MEPARGGTIVSTEALFAYLADTLQPARILLLGEVGGVFDAKNVLIPHISVRNFVAVEAALGEAVGTDVTGGMGAKVRGMVTLGERLPRIEIRIFDGRQQGEHDPVLRGKAKPSTP